MSAAMRNLVVLGLSLSIFASASKKCSQALSLPSYLISAAKLKRRFTRRDVFIEQESAQFVTIIPEGAVWDEGRLLTEDGGIVKDPRLASSGGLHVGRDLSHENFSHFDGQLAVISYRGSENWYHWLLQILPRLIILEESKIPYDKIYINFQNTPWQQTSLSAVLKALNIPKSKILSVTETVLIQANALIVPSIPFDANQPLPRWMKEKLRNIFLNASQRTVGTLQKIYISRANAKTRRIVNEDEVRNFLEEKGFTTIFLENFSPYDQAFLFNGAKTIVGVHGSGFANLVFTESGTRIVEIDQAANPGGIFSDLSARLGCEHIPFFADPRSDDLIVDIEQLNAALR